MSIPTSSTSPSMDTWISNPPTRWTSRRARWAALTLLLTMVLLVVVTSPTNADSPTSGATGTFVASAEHRDSTIHFEAPAPEGGVTTYPIGVDFAAVDRSTPQHFLVDLQFEHLNNNSSLVCEGVNGVGTVEFESNTYSVYDATFESIGNLFNGPGVWVITGRWTEPSHGTEGTFTAAALRQDSRYGRTDGYGCPVATFGTPYADGGLMLVPDGDTDDA